MKEFFLKILITLGFLSPAAPAVVNTTPTQISATSTISTTTVSSPKIISENNTSLYNKDSKGEVKKEVPVTPKVAPVTPVKEEVKREPVKEVVQEVKAEPVQEVKENPFEVVRHDFTYTTEETGELCVQNVKVNVTATNRQGTLERVSKIDIVYMEGNNEIKNDFVKEVQKDQNKDTFDFRGVLCSEYNVSIKVRATSFTNYGGDVKYYTSDWFTIK
jgi:hypothetical protein